MTKTTNITPQLVDQLLAEYQKPEDLLGENGILKQLTKALVERALAAELTDHLGHAHSEAVKNETGNKRNGSSQKTIQGEFGALEIDIPRDRDGSFEPLIVPKRQTRFKGFETKIVSLYARGMSTREIQAHLEEIYGVEVSPTLISNVTDAVVDEIKLWQSRGLEPLYPILFLDCLHLKIRSDGTIKTKAVYVAIGVNLEGQKDVLGLWISENEGSKFWLSVLTELKNRGLQDVFVTPMRAMHDACVDGLKGFPEAIEAVFPKTQVQLCIVHLVRYSLNFVSWKEKKTVATDLRTIYQAPTEQAAEAALEAFSKKWDERYPSISQSWRRNWSRVIPCFAYPREIRKAIYTTNAIESLNFSLRKITKARGSFPSDEAAIKLLFLGLRSITRRWTMPVYDWKAALNRFSIMFEDRMPK
jgi:putative transposase